MSQAEGTSMRDKVFAYLLTVPYGKVVTYAQIAARVGHPRACRAVGNILHSNPDPDRYPCYKVVNAKGVLAPAFAFGGALEQKRRLEQEGIPVKQMTVDLRLYQYRDADK